MTKVLLVVPAYNEAGVLPEFFSKFLRIRASHEPQLVLRLMVVDDGSTDSTLAAIRSAAVANPDAIGYLSFAANAGHQSALIAGLCEAGEWPDVIVTLDADLEHPLEVIPELVAIWERDRSVVVHAIRRASTDLPWHKRIPSALFYRSATALTGLRLEPGQADFRLWDAQTVRSLAGYLPHIGSLRVFGAWIAGRQSSVEYNQAIRAGRQTRFTFRKNLDLAAISIVRFSDVPLKAITVLGSIGLLFSLTYGVFVTQASMHGQTVPGYSSTVLIVMTMGCLQLIALGILASYLRRLVFARDLPAFIVRERKPVGTPNPARPS